MFELVLLSTTTSISLLLDPQWTKDDGDEGARERGRGREEDPRRFVYRDVMYVLHHIHVHHILLHCRSSGIRWSTDLTHEGNSREKKKKKKRRSKKTDRCVCN